MHPFNSCTITHFHVTFELPVNPEVYKIPYKVAQFLTFPPGKSSL